MPLLETILCTYTVFPRNLAAPRNSTALKMSLHISATHPNKHRPRNLTAWYGIDKISVCACALYVPDTNRLIAEAMYARACQSLARRRPRNLAALELSPHGTAP